MRRACFIPFSVLTLPWNIVLVQMYYYYYSSSFSSAFSWIWSICSWEISSNKLHQSLPEIIKLNFWSSGCRHFPFVKMSAFIGSEGENHLHDRQFSDCHDTFFKLFVASVILIAFWVASQRVSIHLQILEFAAES